jgi:hypothetical protein
LGVVSCDDAAGAPSVATSETDRVRGSLLATNNAAQEFSSIDHYSRRSIRKYHKLEARTKKL